MMYNYFMIVMHVYKNTCIYHSVGVGNDVSIVVSRRRSLSADFIIHPSRFSGELLLSLLVIAQTRVVVH
jgi:hypothetical protein